MIRKLAETRINVARQNMSHSDHASHQKTIDLVKEYNAQFEGKVVAIMLDTKVTLCFTVSRARRFEKGLRSEIKRRVAAFELNSYKMVLNKGLVVEKGLIIDDGKKYRKTKKMAEPLNRFNETGASRKFNIRGNGGNMADEYVEFEMSDIEDLVDSSPPPSNYDPSSDSDNSVNNFDLDSDNDSDRPIQDNLGEIIKIMAMLRGIMYRQQRNNNGNTNNNINAGANLMNQLGETLATLVGNQQNRPRSMIA
ncbi:uncharacterized protein LOC108201288 [Daucus carota subsp. sativus]|uniref:uncharacterized protein LOC108201288 n=1 Tax=Daucus carota subsp. sativus TaxID=79200 RepID=UPI0007EFE033|nr:PREDICTED: uncharacterized protein LOC108201288 [Daucus carota subsp. sativus]